MKVLALSSSRVGNSGYLEKAIPQIRQFLGSDDYAIAFIPFAGVQISEAGYGSMVKEAFRSTSLTIDTVLPVNAISIIENADVIMVGGGNTFKLLHDIYQHNLLQLIQAKVKQGIPYIGWSAGANISGRTIGTTNDMPIIQPRSFNALGFLPFQINPHYINQTLEGHNGETRDQRLEEFIALNPGIPVAGLPEGTALELQNGFLRFTGDKDGVLFRPGEGKKRIVQDEDLSALLHI